MTIPSLTKADLLQIDMPVPPIAIQLKFDTLIAKIDLLKVKNTNKFEIDLFSSLSQKAFSGQL